MTATINHGDDPEMPLRVGERCRRADLPGLENCVGRVRYVGWTVAVDWGDDEGRTWPYPPEVLRRYYWSPGPRTKESR